MPRNRITDQQAYEAQQILDAHAMAQAGPIDCYPPSPRQVAEAERGLRDYSDQKNRVFGFEDSSVAVPTDLFDELRVANDRLGKYSDHEGQDHGPTYLFWIQGREGFDAQCQRAIQDHQAAIKVWRKLRKANNKRPQKPPGPELA